MSAHNSLHQHFEVGGAIGGNAIATVNGIGFDTRGIEEVMVVVCVGDVTTSGTLTIQVQDSATNTVFADVSGASFVVDATGGNETYIGRIITNKSGLGRYLRIVGTVAAVVTPYGGCFVAGAQHDKPVTQENTVQFTINEETAN